MTKVKIVRKNNSIILVECDGHTGYGIAGEDIVCAALSSVVQTAMLGILQIVGVNIDLKRDDKRGYLRAELSEDLNEEQRHDCDVILNTMLLGIADLHEGFSDFVELEVK